jgi:threonine/homoserine/homoserine lactone efflux protein
MVEASGSNPDLSISLFLAIHVVEMYEILDTLVLAFIIGFTGALAPGPTLVATVNSSLKSGWTAGPKVAAGHALVEILVFLFIVAGLASAMKEHSRMISIIGGLALIIFGIMTARDSKNASLIVPERALAGGPLLAGAVTSAANPYFWIWWLSVGSSLVLSSLESGIIMAVAFMIGHWGADFGWYTLVSGSLDRGRSILSEKSYRRILAACGIFLVSFGAYFLLVA